MKKTISLVAVLSLAFAAYAEDKEEKDDNDNLEEVYAIADAPAAPRKKTAAWPAFFALCELPATPDLIGLRVTIPFSTKQESVSGFDVGLWGRAQYFEGLQLNALRNDVKDQLTGFQVGLYNSAVQADLFGVQFGLWNETGSLRGVQAGLVNTVGSMQGVQIGIINRAEELYGFQLGIINVIRDAEVAFFPIVNIGF